MNKSLIYSCLFALACFHISFESCGRLLGCGKTLTAEAIAELLEKPLYIVTAGDLGISASEVEKNLGSVLELCQTCKLRVSVFLVVLHYSLINYVISLFDTIVH